MKSRSVIKNTLDRVNSRLDSANKRLVNLMIKPAKLPKKNHGGRGGRED